MFLPLLPEPSVKPPLDDPVAEGSWNRGVRLFVTGKNWDHLFELELETRDALWMDQIGPKTRRTL
jgi:hypothetical protein